MANWQDPETYARWTQFLVAYTDWRTYAGNDVPGEVLLFRVFDHTYVGNDAHSRTLLSNVWYILCNAWHEVRTEHCAQERFDG